MRPAPITAEELPEFVAALRGAFHSDASPEHVQRMTSRFEPERTLVLRDRGRIVATAAIYSRRMTLPGGEVPIAAVTQVGVLPTHRRRGMLTALMHRQLNDVHDAGQEAAAALWAAEGAIYGRFGYGLASLVAELNLDTHDARVRSPAAVRPELRAPCEAVDAMRPIHAQVKATAPGMLDRDGPWWDVRVEDPADEREGYGALRAAVIDGAAYALYAVKVKWENGRPAGEINVREAVAATPEGHAAIWDYLLNLDLTRHVHYELAPSDDPLIHLVTEAQAVPMRLGESLWMRLVDLPRALRERAYAEPFEVVFEVEDTACPWNAGRWALRWDGESAACAATSLPAGLALSAAELGAAYLGGTTLDVLARAGRVRELRAGALARASRAFRGDRAPWCPEIF